MPESLGRGSRGRRFVQALDADAAAMNASIDFDWRLLPHDVAVSVAHAKMLAARGVISADDAARIVASLGRIATELGRPAGPASGMDPGLEDVHMNVETRLTRQIGEAGGRLHTARSRNDQVAADLRLYVLAACGRIRAALADLSRDLVAQAKLHIDTLAPGYTHLQRAQPIRLAHHLLAYVAMFQRDRGRVGDCARRANECPLGSGALAATTFPIDRHAVAAELGFATVTRNSMDAVGDRDFAVELVAAAALAQAHLSRLGEELVLWSSQEFRFVRMPEGFCSGSSMMPQKQNPDIAELVRAKTGRIYGDLVALLTVIKGLPLTYSKDLQETQEPLFDAVETLVPCLQVMAKLVSGLSFDTERLRDAATQGHLVATELADYLAAKEMPFRRAHDATGALVRQATERGVELAALSLEELRTEAPEIGPDVFAWLDPLAAVDRRNIVGGPARPQIVEEIARIERELGPNEEARRPDAPL